uniref:Serine protease n=1 Tax=Haplochromis burtoni TaxID=8153 RepID=A0A3Q2VT31_HAPBU
MLHISARVCFILSNTVCNPQIVTKEGHTRRFTIFHTFVIRIKTKDIIRLTLKNRTSANIITNTRVPQGCVLRPILYTLYTHDCVTSNKDNIVLKFTHDTAVIGRITGGDKAAYRREVTDENIIIQLGKEDKKSIVATHLPCSCIDDGECLIISRRAEKVEGKVQHSKIVHPKGHYSVFYIDTVGGLHTKTKELFKNNDVKQFKNLCVYGEKGITVAEALKRDGRFIDDLGNFELSNNQDPKRFTVCTQKVEKLHQKQFKIRLPKDKKENNGKSQESPTNNSQSNCERRSDRFPGDLYQEALNLRKENFGKIQQSFSEVHRVRKLLELGKSVCKVIVKDVSMGTGFVLFDTFILTSAHLFQGFVEGKELQQDVEVLAVFDYEKSEPETNFYYFRAENTFTDFDADLDYAVLEAQNIKVPPGLLSEFGPLPANGEACIIGHPTDKRGQAIDEHLYQYKNLLIIKTISDWLKEHGINDILIGGRKAGKVATYHTFMYHGASGSPVFDGLGRVFGLHTAGYICDSVNSDESVIEYAIPLLTIFENFVENLKESENKELLKKAEKAAKRNPHLKEILNAEEPMEAS